MLEVRSGTAISELRFTDVIPAGTVYINNSLRAITNEGVYGPGITNTGLYTDAAFDDQGTLLPGNIIYINLGDATGFGTLPADGGSIAGGVTRPTFFGVNTIIQAAYRVQVTAGYFNSIPLTGLFSFFDGTSQINNSISPKSITILPPLSCGGLGGFNFITDENGGDFSSGTVHDRGVSANAIGFTYTGVTPGTPQDGSYSVAKNTSPTEYTGGSPAAGDRVFTVWDVLGDHTGTNDATGNPPSASGSVGGYMLVVNATYAPSEIFNTMISGLTANTVYTMSFWVRNICSLCGADPVTGGSSSSPGVKPNLSFEINGSGVYTTGEIEYTG
ncbi:MAG: hypothetical protein ACRC2O_02125, partial [Chitinophagaceae bacterium]